MPRIYKLFLLLFFLTLCFKNVSAQYPFYGFELSNYEVGDTLEYSTLSYGFGDCGGTDIYVIIKKDILAINDSIRYTIKDLEYNSCNYGGRIYSGTTDITYGVGINNDTIYLNHNNLLGATLYPLDTTGMNVSKDSMYYLQYDTVNSLKRLKLKHYSGLGESYAYEVIQNIGIIHIDSADESSSSGGSAILIYARLAHYGTYGIYQYISDGITNQLAPQTNISIRYDNGGNAYLYYTSTQNIQQPILSVYDLMGRKAETQAINIGTNLIENKNLPAGVYLYRVESGNEIIGQGKIVNMKN